MSELERRLLNEGRSSVNQGKTDSGKITKEGPMTKFKVPHQL